MFNKYLLLILVITTIVSCKKYEVDKTNIQNNQDAPESFSWTTTKDLNATISFTGELATKELAFQLLDENFNHIMKLVKAPTKNAFNIEQVTAGHYEHFYFYIPEYKLYKKVAVDAETIEIGTSDIENASQSTYTFHAGSHLKSDRHKGTPLFGKDNDDDDDDSDDDDDDSDDDDGDSDDDDGDSDDDDTEGDGDDNVESGSFNYPSSGFAFRAFEDLWPAKGDYDFNDLVIAYKYVATTNAKNQVTSISFDMRLPAIGAGHHNGIALQFLSKNGNAISRISNNVFSGNQPDVSIDRQDNSVVIISQDVFQTIPTYYRNVGDGADGVAAHSFSFTINVNASANVQPSNMIADLFLFRSEERGLEVHLPGIPPSNAVDDSKFETVDDASQTIGYYRGNDNLPWALELINVSDWDHPLSKVKIWDAYPEFTSWVNSNGAQNATWFNNPNPTLVYDVSTLPE